MPLSNFLKMHKSKTIMASCILFAAILATILVTTTTGNEQKSLRTKELKLVHVIMRHGVRTPASTYPKDPYVNYTFSPVGWGQLTNQGKLQLYDVGKFLRHRYDKFLGDHFTPELYFTQSTDVDRTKASMQLVNAGLWPPKGDQIWGPIPWQPIPIHAEPLDQDMLLLVRKPCAQYSLEQIRVKNSPEIQEKLRSYQPMFEKVSKLTGQKMEDFADAEDVFSTLTAEKYFNLTLPEWTKDYYDDLEEPTVFFFVFNSYSDKMKRLKGGVLLKKLIQDWKAKQNDELKTNFFLYGGHDSTIANLLSTLNIWDPQIPGYAITILVEMSKDTNSGEYGIEIFLRNSTKVAPHLLTIPGCQSFCPLNQLIKITEPVVPVNWEEECKSDDPNFTPPPAGGP